MSNDDHLALYGRWRGTRKGKTVDMPFASVWRFAGSQVLAFNFFPGDQHAYDELWSL